MKPPRRPATRAPREPWQCPNPIPRHVIYAFKALAAGKASEGQQKVVLSFITFELCGITRDAFDPRDRITEYSLGQQAIGKMIAKIVETPVKGLDGQGNEEEIPAQAGIEPQEPT